MKIRSLKIVICIFLGSFGMVIVGKGEVNSDSHVSSEVKISRKISSTPVTYNRKFEIPEREEFREYLMYAIQEAETTENRIRKFVEDKRVHINRWNKGIFGKVSLDDGKTEWSYSFRSSELDLKQVNLKKVSLENDSDNGSEKPRKSTIKYMGFSFLFDDSDCISSFGMGTIDKNLDPYQTFGLGFYPENRLKTFRFSEGSIRYVVNWDEKGGDFIGTSI